MRKKVRFLAETGMLLALLIALQWAGSTIPEPLTKQLVTGSLVNCVLAVAVLMTGISGGLAVALISPVCAFLLNIAPVLMAVPVIMLGNVSFVLLLSLLRRKAVSPWLAAGVTAGAAVTKFGILYLLGVKLICGVLAQPLNGKVFLGAPVMSAKVVKQLMNMFAWPQLVTALTGCLLAFAVVPVLKKALHRD